MIVSTSMSIIKYAHWLQLICTIKLVGQSLQHMRKITVRSDHDQDHDQDHIEN